MLPGLETKQSDRQLRHTAFSDKAHIKSPELNAVRMGGKQDKEKIK